MRQLMDFFPKLLDLSLIAGIVILFVIAARFFLKKAPKIFSYALWAVVLFRLLCPVSIESSVSIVPQVQVPGVYQINEALPDIEFETYSDYQHNKYVRENMQPGDIVVYVYTVADPILYLTLLWLAGMAAMLIFGLLSYRKLKKRLKIVIPLRENIYIADDVDTPFVVGFFRPKIFLPGTLDVREQDYIISHEQHHIKRGDHITKLIAFLALTLHWFNPLVWLAFCLAVKDMEMSCDEAVIKKLGADIRADYSASLLSLATGKKGLGGIPLAFGEGNTKDRIRNLARWKKPVVWVSVAALLVCVGMSGCLLTDTQNGAELAVWGINEYYLTIGVEGITSIQVTTPEGSGGCQNADGSPFEVGEQVYIEQLDGLDGLRGVGIKALDKDGQVMFAMSIPEQDKSNPIYFVGEDGWALTLGKEDVAIAVERPIEVSPP